MSLKVLNILGIKDNEMIIITIGIQVDALKIHFNYS